MCSESLGGMSSAQDSEAGGDAESIQASSWPKSTEILGSLGPEPDFHYPIHLHQFHKKQPTSQPFLTMTTHPSIAS